MEGSRGASGLTWHRLASRLVVVEIAAAIVLLVGAGLLGKSLYRLLHVDIGLQAEHLATITVTAPNAKYSNNEQTIALVRQIEDRIGSLPGVDLGWDLQQTAARRRQYDVDQGPRAAIQR